MASDQCWDDVHYWIGIAILCDCRHEVGSSHLRGNLGGVRSLSNIASAAR